MARPPGQHGRLDLALRAVAGKTLTERAYAAPPLQLSRLRYDDPQRPDWAHFTLLHLAGVLDGDRYDLDVALDSGASATVSSAAATLVHAMPHGAAELALRLNLAAGSRLCWLPEPLILYGGASYSQTTHVTLGTGALLVLREVLCMGRVARGEAFAFTRFGAQLEVTDSGGRLLLSERAALEPGEDAPTALGMFGRAQVLGSLYILSDALDAEACCAQIDVLAGRTVGATVLPNGCGVLIRQLGQVPATVNANLERLWDALRPLVLRSELDDQVELRVHADQRVRADHGG